MTKKHRNGEISEFDRELSAGTAGGRAVGDVILGIDGGTTSTTCVCLPFLHPHSLHLPDSLPLLARVEAGCSNHNSVGGTLSLSLLSLSAHFCIDLLLFFHSFRIDFLLPLFLIVLPELVAVFWMIIECEVVRDRFCLPVSFIQQKCDSPWGFLSALSFGIKREP